MEQYSDNEILSKMYNTTSIFDVIYNISLPSEQRHWQTYEKSTQPVQKTYTLEVITANHIFSTESSPNIENDKIPQPVQIILIFVTLAAIMIVILTIILISYFKRYNHYSKVPNVDPYTYYEYIYKPIQGNAHLDSQYEHTFVGVSIPILQDNTRI